MTRKPGQKSLGFLGKRMRLVDDRRDAWTVYQRGEWTVEIRNGGGSYYCSLGHKGATYCDIFNFAPTAEAAIAECEAQALALFKQLGELCGYEVEE